MRAHLCKFARRNCANVQTCLRCHQKAINKVNESFQTHNGGAIIERRLLSAAATATAIYYLHKYF